MYATYREAMSEGALQQEAAAKDVEAAAAKQEAAAAERRSISLEEELTPLRIKLAAMNKVLSRTATERAVHALASKKAEARVDSAEFEVGPCTTQIQLRTTA